MAKCTCDVINCGGLQCDVNLALQMLLVFLSKHRHDMPGLDWRVAFDKVVDAALLGSNVKAENKQLRYLFFDRLGCYGFDSLRVSPLGMDGLKGYMDTLDFYDTRRELLPTGWDSRLDREIESYVKAGFNRPAANQQ